MKRMTFVEPNGVWGVCGMNADNEKEKVYGCICKLRDYEDSGLSPYEVGQMIDKVYDMEKKLETIEKEHEQVKERISIGTVIQGYVVTAITDTSAMAERRHKIGADDYVVWNIDRDKCGVNNGMYYEEKEGAVFNFANRLQRVRI